MFMYIAMGRGLIGGSKATDKRDPLKILTIDLLVPAGSLGLSLVKLIRPCLKMKHPQAWSESRTTILDFDDQLRHKLDK